MLNILVFWLRTWVSSCPSSCSTSWDQQGWEMPRCQPHSSLPQVLHSFSPQGCRPWTLWSFLSWDLSWRALNGKLNQYSMDVSYFYLKISAFMMLRLIYSIPISIGQMNTKYKMLDWLRPWKMASLAFRDLDEPWRQVGLLGREILMWKCLCRTHSWKTTAERTSHKHAAHRGCP